jgi:hypothetical protein
MHANPDHQHCIQDIQVEQTYKIGRILASTVGQWDETGIQDNEVDRTMNWDSIQDNELGQKDRTMS